MPNVKILVVEDEAIVAMDIQERLQALGYNVVGTASTAKAAIDAVTKHKPNLVLMDIQIQGEHDGVQAAKHILKSHDLPVIFLTANSDPKTLERVKGVGPFGYLLKPFEERDLSMAIDVALHRHRLECELRISKEWYVTTLECIGDGVIATDANYRVKFLNPAAERLTWVKGADVIGRPLREVFHLLDSQRQPALLDLIDQATDQGIAVKLHGYTLSTSITAKSIPVSGSVASISDALGRSMGVIVVFRPAVEEVQNCSAITSNG